MSKASPAGRSRLSLPDLDLIASQTGLVIRRSAKFTPGAFLQTLLSSVATGQASLNQLVAELKDRAEAPMVRQSLHERFDERSTAFLITVLCNLTEQRYQPAVEVLRDGPVLRVFIEDSTSQVMPKANAASFPAHGNHHGLTAGVKIDLTFDLLTGAVIAHSLQAATEQDKTIGKEVIHEVRRGDLVLRDMGYFCLGEFDAIEQRGAFWLTRLPLTAGVVLEDGVLLEDRLKRSRSDILDLGAVVGKQGKSCRLVAVRAAAEVVEARRAQRRAKARKSGAKPCPKGLIRDGWHLLLTNLAKEQMSVSQLMAVYRARWAVEVQFRAWKQSLNLDKALKRRSNGHHMQALVLAAMIAHQLGMRVAARIGGLMERGRLSYEKLYDLLALRLVKARNWCEAAAFDPEPKHIMRDRRRRKSPVESGLQALT